MTNGPARLLMLLAALCVLAAVALAIDHCGQMRRERLAREFQSLVGGLGLGPATDLASCAFAFDPRLAPRCPHEHGPIPCGAAFCRHHGTSIFHFPPLDREDRQPPAEHAPPP
jgi:hypothetical protein